MYWHTIMLCFKGETMKQMLLVLLAMVAIALGGCGGGGGGSAPNADAGFFATDNLWAGYEGVWGDYK